MKEEKGIVKSCVPGVKGFFNCESESGVKGQSKKEYQPGDAVTIVTTDREYEGKILIYFNDPKPEKKGFGQPKDWTFEKKKSALECACTFAATLSDAKTSGDVVRVAETFFKFLNDK